MPQRGTPASASATRAATPGMKNTNAATRKLANGKYNRIKGHTFEREIAALFCDALGDPTIRRTLQTRGAAEDGADVVADPFWIECKRQKKPRIVAALEQSERDCPKGWMPVAITKANREPAIVSLRLTDFLDLVKEWRERAN